MPGAKLDSSDKKAVNLFQVDWDVVAGLPANRERGCSLQALNWVDEPLTRASMTP